METQRFYHPQDPIRTHEAAAKLYHLCRQKSITIRSNIDCLIAQIAIEHDLILLHHDQDYIRLKNIAPALKLATP